MSHSKAPEESGTPSKPPEARRKLSRLVDAVLFVAILGVLVLALFPKKSGPSVGEPAAVLTLATVGNLSEDSRVLAGDLQRPLLIEAFASWCGACRRNASLLGDLSEAQEQGQLDVVAVSVDESPEQALAAKQSWPIPVEVLHDGSGKFSRAYQVDVLPTYILVGIDGRVKRVTSGNPGASDIRAWLNEHRTTQ